MLIFDCIHDCLSICICKYSASYLPEWRYVELQQMQYVIETLPISTEIFILPSLLLTIKTIISTNSQHDFAREILYLLGENRAYTPKELRDTYRQWPGLYLWLQSLRILEQKGWNINLNERECINIRALSQNIVYIQG